MGVGKNIGRPIKVDEATSLVSRCHFAGMCVEVDLEKPLMSKFEFHRKVRRVEYEGIHLICFNCGRYNHGKEECPLVLQNGAKEPKTLSEGMSGQLQMIKASVTI